MEWRLEGQGLAVVVDPGFHEAVMRVLEGTNIPLDPYRDHRYGPSTVARLASLFEAARRTRRDTLVQGTLARLALRVREPWAEGAIDADLAGDAWLAVLEELAGLCAIAAEVDGTLEVLGS